jgi:transposase
MRVSPPWGCASPSPATCIPPCWPRTPPISGPISRRPPGYPALAGWILARNGYFAKHLPIVLACSAWTPGRVTGSVCDTYHRTAGVRHLFAAYELGEDKLFGHVKPRKTRARFLEFCRYLRSLYPVTTRIAIVCDNFSPHLSTRRDRRVGDWAKASNVEIACTPTNSSWLNRIEAQFTALRYFALDGTDHASHAEQASMIRRYVIWRNNHAYDERLRRIIAKANVA